MRPKRDKPTKNRSVDILGSKVAQVHLMREQALNGLRPGPSMRTALTGHVKRGYERQPKSGKKRKAQENVGGVAKSKQRKVQ